jgi:hypothetical protein
MLLLIPMVFLLRKVVRELLIKCAEEDDNNRINCGIDESRNFHYQRLFLN